MNAPQLRAVSTDAGNLAEAEHRSPDVQVKDPAAPLALVTATKPAAEKSPFLPAPSVPTQKGERGIRYDFNDGCRIVLPAATAWRVRIRDAVTDNVLFETQTKANGSDDAGTSIYSAKKYFVPFEFEVFSGDEEVMRHRLELKDRPVLIQFPVGTLGDLVGWFPYAVKFEAKHGCKLTCSMGAPLIALFATMYPSITFVTPEAVRTEEFYATYNIGLFFNDEKNIHQPCDFRAVGLHRTAGYILGVSPDEEPPKLYLPDESRPIPDKYVCIATQSSTQTKYWNYPGGWLQIVQFLKDHGYRVICIDQRATHGDGLLVCNNIPHGAENETGDRPLAERARWMKHADFFIGLSSGLSWLAWAVGTPVVMISGFTHPTNEFHTPYRVINYHTCNSCWNDVRVMFDHHDFLWCPRHAGTPRQFECTRLIPPEQVRGAIRSIPIFAA